MPHFNQYFDHGKVRTTGRIDFPLPHRNNHLSGKSVVFNQANLTVVTVSTVRKLILKSAWGIQQ